MSFYIYAPGWFSGFDSFLELITIFTSLFIAIYSYKTYKYFKLKKYKYFSITFFLFAISFISKIISNLIFIVPKKREITIYFYTIIYTTYQKIEFIDKISFFIHKISMLIALLILFLIITKEEKIETISILTIFTIILAFLVENYLLFNFLIIIITGYLFLISHIKHIKNSSKKNSNINLFFLGFAISHFLLFLAIKNSIFYFLGEITLIITFIYILNKFIQIFKK